MGVYTDSKVQAIANAIRERKGTSETYNIGEMANAITNLPVLSSKEGIPLQYKAKSYGVGALYKGNVEQDTTTGKNLFDVYDVTSTTSTYGLTYECKNNVIKISGTNTRTTAYGLLSWSRSDLKAYFNGIFKVGETYTLSVNKKGIAGLYVAINYYINDTTTQNGMANLSLNNEKITFTVPSNYGGIAQIFVGVYGNATTINAEFSLQLEKNNQATSYEPYTNGASPNPDYPQEVKTVRGWNLVGLDTQQYKVDLKAGDKITACNTGTNQLTIQLFTNYGDTTRNDFWTINGGVTRTITVGYDTKALSWKTSPIGGIAYINKGDNLKPYLPYNCIGVKRTGKNLFDTELVQGARNNTDGKTIIGSNNYVRNKEYIKVEPNTTYTIKSKTSTTTVGGDVHYLDKDMILIKKTSFGISHTTTTPNGCYYINFQYYNSGGITPSDFTEIQVEKGTTATAYELYQEQISYIDLKGNEILTTDELIIDNGQVSLKKNWGKVVLDGSEPNWQIYTATSKSVFFIPTLFNYKKINGTICYSNLLQGKATTNTFDDCWDYGNNIICFRSTYERMVIRRDDITNVDDFKTWLSTNKPIVYYQLATPEEIDLGSVDLRSINGENNVEILATIEPTYMKEQFIKGE